MKLLITLLVVSCSIHTADTKAQIVAFVSPHGITEKEVTDLLKTKYPINVNALSNWLLIENDCQDRFPENYGGLEKSDSIPTVLSKVIPLLARYHEEQSSVKEIQ